MASRSVDMGGLPEIGQTSGAGLDQIVKLASLMNVLSDTHAREAKLKAEMGTPATPASVRGTPAPGYQAIPQITGGGLPDSMTPYGAKMEPGVASLLGTPAPLYVKGGASGIVGTVETARRHSLMPYSDPNQLGENISLLNDEANPQVFNENLALAPKGTKANVTVSKEASDLFKSMGVDIEPGVLPEETYKQVKDLLAVKNLGKTPEGSDAALKKARAELENLNAQIKLKKEQAAKVESTRKAFEKIMGTDTSTGTAKTPEQNVLTGVKIHINRRGQGPGWILESDFNPVTDTKIP